MHPIGKGTRQRDVDARGQGTEEREGVPAGALRLLICRRAPAGAGGALRLPRRQWLRRNHERHEAVHLAVVVSHRDAVALHHRLLCRGAHANTVNKRRLAALSRRLRRQQKHRECSIVGVHAAVLGEWGQSGPACSNLPRERQMTAASSEREGLSSTCKRCGREGHICRVRAWALSRKGLARRMRSKIYLHLIWME